VDLIVILGCIIYACAYPNILAHCKMLNPDLQINLSFNRAVPNALTLVHQGELKSRSNDRHLYREVYLLVVLPIRALKRTEIGDVHGLLGLDRRSLAHCSYLPSRWLPIVACENGC
jgi:hypothetical protein